MPSVQVDEVEHASNDNEVISELEHIMSDWGTALTEVMQREAEKHPVGTGPLAGLLLSLWLPCNPSACHTPHMPFHTTAFQQSAVVLLNCQSCSNALVRFVRLLLCCW